MSRSRLPWCVHSGWAGNTDLANWTWRIESSGWFHGIKSHRIKFFPCCRPQRDFKVGSMRGSFSEVPGSLGWQRWSLGGKATFFWVQSVAGSISRRLLRCHRVLGFCASMCVLRRRGLSKVYHPSGNNRRYDRDTGKPLQSRVSRLWSSFVSWCLMLKHVHDHCIFYFTFILCLCLAVRKPFESFRFSDL